MSFNIALYELYLYYKLAIYKIQSKMNTVQSD